MINHDENPDDMERTVGRHDSCFYTVRLNTEDQCLESSWEDSAFLRLFSGRVCLVLCNDEGFRQPNPKLSTFLGTALHTV